MFHRLSTTVANVFRRSASQPRAHHTDPRPAQRAEVSGGEPDVPKAGERYARAFAILCFVIAIGSPGSVLDTREVTIVWPHHLRDLLAWVDWAVQLRWTLGVLVIAPFAFSAIVVSSLNASRSREQDLTLVPYDPPIGDDLPWSHAELDKALWAKRKRAIEISWDYERSRVLQSQRRLRLHALIFGDVTSFTFLCSALVLSSYDEKVLGELAYSVTAATATVFLLGLARIMLRISGCDVTSGTFAWATRSLILVIIADIGLHALIQKEISGIIGALLLGVFVGATGGAAIQLVQERGAKFIGIGKTEAAPTRSQPLDIESIEGMTAEHVKRLEEEDILSVHDLAFAPTARLFFATAYSLQQIVNWQDRALLLVYVGKKAADVLAEKMEIRGALDLRSFAHRALHGSGPEAAEIKEALRSTLTLDPGGFDALLVSMAHDEVTMRLRYFWGSVVAPRRQGEASHGVGGAVGGDGSRAAPAQPPVTSLTLDVTPDGFPARESTVFEARADRE